MNDIFYIGIDPGISGGIAIIAPNHGAVLYDMPVLGTSKKEIDYTALAQLVREFPPNSRAIIEQVGGMPGQSAPAAFVFGCNYMAVFMAVSMCRIPIFKVPPARWKNFYHIPRDKGAAVSLAQQLFPAGEFTTKRGASKDGRAEAFLIGEYGRRNAL